MALLVEDEVKGLREWVTKISLMVEEQLKDKSQVLKNRNDNSNDHGRGLFCGIFPSFWGETPKQVSKIPHMVEEGS